MKLEKLLCLKCRGRRNVEKECKSQTTKLVPPLFQDTMWSVFGSSTISNVLIRNGGGPISCNPSTGFGGGSPSWSWNGFIKFSKPQKKKVLETQIEDWKEKQTTILDQRLGLVWWNLDENESCGAAGRFKFVDGSWVEKRERKEGNPHVSDARWLK